jgi:Holliday junction resolvase RusA-like endonuclease
MIAAPFVNDEFLRWLDPEKPDYDSARRVIIAAYNLATGSNIDPIWPKDDKRLIPVVIWLNRLEMDGVETCFIIAKRQLTRLFSSCLSSKVSYLAQHYCDICRSSKTIATIPIRIRSRSHQASTPAVKAAFKKAISHRLVSAHRYARERLCVHITVACSNSSRTIDLDNAAKLLLDSMKGTVFEDDSQVDHLSILRVRACGEEDYLYLHIGSSTVNEHHDLVFAGVHHSWAGQAPLNLEEFM